MSFDGDYTLSITQIVFTAGIFIVANFTFMFTIILVTIKSQMSVFENNIAKTISDFKNSVKNQTSDFKTSVENQLSEFKTNQVNLTKVLGAKNDDLLYRIEKALSDRDP